MTADRTMKRNTSSKTNRIPHTPNAPRAPVALRALFAPQMLNARRALFALRTPVASRTLFASLALFASRTPNARRALFALRTPVASLALLASLVLFALLPGALGAGTPEDLLKAARYGQTAKIKKLLEEGVSLESKGDDGKTVVMVAAHYGRMSDVTYLIEAGARLDARDNEGQTLLHLLAASGDARARKALSLAISKSADLNAKNNEGLTPVALALDKKRYDKMQILLDAGANVNVTIKVKDETMPLAIYAYEKTTAAVCKQILAKGADINAKIEPSGNTLLHRVVFWNNKDMTEHVLSLNPSLEMRNGDGRTPLMVALEKDRWPLAELLLEKGANVTGKDMYGQTVTHYLESSKQLELLKKVIEKGAPISDKDFRQRTPLILALDNKRLDNVSYLISKGARAEDPDDKGNTPVMRYALAGKMDVAQALVEGGVNVKKTNHEGQTLLHILSASGWYAAAKVIPLVVERGGNIEARDNEGLTPLAVSIKRKKIKNLEALLAAGAKPAGKIDDWHVTFYAYEKWSSNICLLLLEKGADKSLRNDNNQTLLHRAMDWNDQGFTPKFLEMKPDLDPLDNDHRTPLMIALKRVRIDLAWLLMQKGARLDLADNEGWTVQHYLASYNTPAMLAFTAGKVKNDVADREGRTPLAVAISGGKTKNVELLLEGGANPNGQDEKGNRLIALALQKNRVAIAKLLLAKGADLTVKDKEGNTLLKLAAQTGNVEFINVLLEKGANVHEKSADGSTPLFAAAAGGHKAAAALLAEKGADVNARNNDNETPLMKAAAGSASGHYQTAKDLIEKGADPNAASKSGQAALHMAIEARNPYIVELLLSKGANANVLDPEGNTLIMRLSAVKYEKSWQSTPAVKILKALIKGGGNPNALNNYGSSALNMAIKLDNGKIIDALIDSGADVDQRDKNGNTVLKKVVLSYIFDYHSPKSRDTSRENMIKHLLKKKADINKSDAQGRTALADVLRLVSEFNRGKVMNIVPFLLKNGANKHVKDKSGNNAIRYADKSGDQDIIGLLK